MSDYPVTRILSAVERLRVEVLARIDRLESVSRGNPDLLPARVVAHVQNVGDLGDWVGERLRAVGLKDLESPLRRTLSQKNSYIGLSSDAIGNRVALAHALIDGRAVTEFEPAGKAAGELRKLFNEMETRLWPEPALS